MTNYSPSLPITPLGIGALLVTAGLVSAMATRKGVPQETRLIRLIIGIGWTCAVFVADSFLYMIDAVRVPIAVVVSLLGVAFAFWVDDLFRD